MNIRAKVKEIILDILDISESELDFDQSLGAHLGASSVLMVELLAELENQFEVDITDEDAMAMRTPNDIVKYLEGKVDA